jgi:transcriptional regulator with XRE-family HTH domain
MDVANTLHSNDQLRQERIRHNWRQQDLADQLGTTAVTVRRWERGSQQPSAYFRIKLCALFGKSSEELGLGAVNPLPSPSPKRDVSEEIPMSSSPTDNPALWTVPYRRNLYFTGRDELITLLDQHLSGARSGEVTTTHRAALTQPQAIKGLGGIGKTQIAVEYAYRAREQEQYIHTFWINAASQEALMSSFTQLAEVLPAFAAKDETDQHKLVVAIKRWLEQCQERWLLIFDNADDLSLVQDYIPHAGNGSILLTTRANAVGSLAMSIEVETMSFVEGTHLLLRRAQRFLQASDEEVNEAGNIVVALDHFPLALEQAGAYIEETGCSLQNYLQLYQTHRKILLARRGTIPTR